MFAVEVPPTAIQRYVTTYVKVEPCYKVQVIVSLLEVSKMVPRH